MPETIINIDNYIVGNEFEGWGYTTPREVKKQMDKAEGDIRFDINSGGGLVFSAWEIVNAIKSYDKGEVTTRITGMAASAAGVVFLAADKREVFDKSYYMAHPAWSVLVGNEYEIRSELYLLEQIDRTIVEDIAALTKEKLSDVKEKIRDGYHLIGKNIKDVGIATDVVEGVAKEPAKPDRDLDGEEANNLHNCMKNHKIDKNIKITNLHAKEKSWLERSLENSNLGGPKKVDEKEAKELLAKNEVLSKQIAEHAEVIKNMEAEKQDAIKQERSRVGDIYQLAGEDTESAQKAVNEGTSVGDFAIQQLKKSQAEKASWKDLHNPADFEDPNDDLESIANKALIDEPTGEGVQSDTYKEEMEAKVL